MKKNLIRTGESSPSVKLTLLRMKLSVLFLFTAFMAMYANDSYAQRTKITLNLQDVTVARLLDEIESRTDFRFVYQVREVDLNRRLSIQGKEASVFDILERCFKNTPTGYQVIDKQIFLRKTEKPNRKDAKQDQTEIELDKPQFQVSGSVTDEDGNPLPGANIIEKGTTNGVTADFDGRFALNIANQNATLVISYIGFAPKEVQLNGQLEIRVSLMEDASKLDEVVLIGYGSVKQKDLSGAVASVTGEDLQTTLAKSAAGALQGRIVGVSVSNMGGQPGAGMSINIRGLSSLGSNTPLYVIDGVYGDINMVDPSDIATIDVLKDASAAAIYGSRAANGVVLITTKSGKRDTPLTIDIHAYTGMQTITKKLDVLDAQEWKNIMRSSGYLPQEAENFVGPGTNWQDEIYRAAPISKLNVSISGGGENSTYNVSTGYIDQEGILLNTGYKAVNLRFKNTFGFFDNHLRIGNTLMMNSGDEQYSDFTITDALRQNPMISIYNPDQLGGYARFEPWMKNLDNPVGYLALHDYHRYKTDILLNAYAEVDLGLKGLKYKFNLGVNRTQGRNYRYNDAYDFGSGVVKSSLSEDAFFNNQWLAENTLHYDNTFDKHNVSFLVGYSAQSNSNRGFGASRKDVPFGTNAISAASPTEQNTFGGLQEYSLVSMFSRLVYSYDSRYLLTASVRRDGSSRFADGNRYGVFPSLALGWNIANEQFFEPLKDQVSELKLRASYGKLGNQEIGNYATQNIVNTGINYLQGSGSNQSWWQGASTGVNWVSPKNLTWEETSTNNIGLDAAFFGNKLTLNADYYTRETRNILLSINMPPSVGLGGSPTMNAGTIENKGFEVLLNYRNSINDFHYNIGVNASAVKNKVKAVTVGNIQEFEGYNPQNEGTISWAKVGYPIGSFWAIKTDGIFQSDAEAQAYTNGSGVVIQPNAEAGDLKFVDFNGDGQISNDDRQYIGSPIPKVSYGIRGGFDYKGIDFSLFFDGMYGNKIYNYTRARMESTNEIINFSDALLDSWTPTNTGSDIPRFTQQDANQNWRRVNDRWLENGSFLRLKSIEVGYSFKGDLLEKVKLKSARVFAAGQNLFTMTDYEGYTPDLGQNNGQNGGGSGTMTQGTDHGRFPLARTITAGLQVNF